MKRNRRFEAGILDNEVWAALRSCKAGRELITLRLQGYRKLVSASSRHDGYVFAKNILTAIECRINETIEKAIDGTPN